MAALLASKISFIALGLGSFSFYRFLALIMFRRFTLFLDVLAGEVRPKGSPPDPIVSSLR